MSQSLQPELPSATSCLSRRRLRDSGHLLLAILLMMAMMVIAATYEAPRMVQQLKRDREEEMIHRGTEYARAIKKYYKKMGSYPSTIEQLENTNNIRFLRKRYKDPLTKDGKWTLLHYNDVAASLITAGGPGLTAAGLAGQGQQGLGSPAGQQGSSTSGSSSANEFRRVRDVELWRRNSQQPVNPERDILATAIPVPAVASKRLEARLSEVAPASEAPHRKAPLRAAPPPTLRASSLRKLSKHRTRRDQ